MTGEPSATQDDAPTEAAKPAVSSKERARLQRVAEAGARARAEAEARRTNGALDADAGPPEKGGQKGPDPARYGDWEKDGIVSDF